jgi:hypothetical protein
VARRAARGSRQALREILRFLTESLLQVPKLSQPIPDRVDHGPFPMADRPYAERDLHDLIRSIAVASEHGKSRSKVALAKLIPGRIVRRYPHFPQAYQIFSPYAATEIVRRLFEEVVDSDLQELRRQDEPRYLLSCAVIAAMTAVLCDLPPKDLNIIVAAGFDTLRARSLLLASMHGRQGGRPRGKISREHIQLLARCREELASIKVTGRSQSWIVQKLLVRLRAGGVKLTKSPRSLYMLLRRHGLLPVSSKSRQTLHGPPSPRTNGWRE